MTGAGIAMRTADLPVGRSLFPVQGVFPGQSAPHLSRTARLRRNCASSAAFRSRAAESVSCTVCRMCGGVCEYVRHAAEFMRFRCPACARRRELPARGACRAGDGVFSEFTNRITLLKQRNSGLKPPRYCPRGILGRQSGIMRFRSGYASAAFSEPGIFRSRFIRTAAAAHTRNSVTGNAIHIPEICRVRFSSHIKGKSRIP